ncbi:protease inhibitor I42 family protein [Streptomyces spongiae]|uniref:Protease inhibitor I42 family protein n=2 Tax=Streptomyces spongiae TaxID=565072 RepID=A0A5N8X9U8_9ACTN|nr:protease inhibitor I42 family protein [Streptomyces spongiae]
MIVNKIINDMPGTHGESIGTQRPLTGPYASSSPRSCRVRRTRSEVAGACLRCGEGRCEGRSGLSALPVPERFGLMGEVHVSPRDSEVNVSLGDEVVVPLPENATTGYRWSVQRADGLEVTSSGYEAGQPVLPGSGGTRVVRVRPTAAGKGLLELELKRAWADDVADRFSLRVTVTAAH